MKTYATDNKPVILQNFITIHHKKRYITHLERQITTLKAAPIRVTISTQAECFFLGSKGETCGNQVFQFDGLTVKVRVPECLESKYGAGLTNSIKSSLGCHAMTSTVFLTGNSRSSL